MDENVRPGVKGHRRRMRIRKKKEKQNVGISSYDRRFLNSSFSSFFSLVKKKSCASSLYELACFFNCCLLFVVLISRGRGNNGDYQYDSYFPFAYAQCSTEALQSHPPLPQ